MDLILLALILGLGGGPDHDRIRFRYWKNPGTMEMHIATSPNTGRFLGFFSTLVNAAFFYRGVETVAVAAGEAEKPRHKILKAIHRVF